MATKDTFEAFFESEALSSLGVEACLPQHIEEPFFLFFLQEAERVLDSDVELSMPYEEFSLLVNTVVLIESSQRKKLALDIAEEELLRKVGIFALAVRLESLRRTGVIEMIPPSLGDIFDTDKSREIKLEAMPGGGGDLSHLN